jgi:hypothetical protein
MIGSTDPPVAGDVTLKGLIVFGSHSVSLAARPDGIAGPRLPFHDPAAILQDGKPNPMSALHWQYRLAATLRGRDADLEKILAWPEGGGNTVSARLITGPGGAGKTRLAAEAARALRQRGWSDGFLPRDARSGQVIDASERDGGGLLLIIDYPEERLEVGDAKLRATPLGELDGVRGTVRRRST